MLLEEISIRRLSDQMRMEERTAKRSGAFDKPPCGLAKKVYLV